MIPRLYLSHPLHPDHPVPLDEGQRRYLTRTLRMGTGDPLILFSSEGERGEWSATLIQEEGRLMARLVAFHPLKVESPLQITLVLGLAKGNVTEFVIQKAVELGAAAILPLVSQRSVRRAPKERQDNKLSRWRKIIQEATEQCGRTHPPRIDAPASWEELAYRLPADGPRYLFWEEEAGRGITLKDLPPPQEQAVTLMIGPEGGFAEEEVRLAVEQLAFQVVTLGPRILRSDTAGVAVLSGVQILWGDMG